MTNFPTITDALNHAGLFRPWFYGASWNPWHTVLNAGFALPMSPDEIEFFKSVAGGREPPKRRVREAWFVVGRGGGKDSTASVIAAHAAVSFDPAILRPGERALVACIAPDRDTGKIVQRYIGAFFERIAPLKAMVQRIAESDGIIELSNSVDVMVMTKDFRSIRGRPVLCAILDEVAFLRDENSTSPDVELYRALLPGMRLPQSMLIGISSRYRKAGLLFERYRKHFGENSDDVLVIQAPSHVMNPTLDTRERDRMMIEDRSAALAEYYAQFRDDLVQFIDPATVDRAVVAGLTELAPVPGITYTAAVDPSGGSSDSMTLAIAHSEGTRSPNEPLVQSGPDALPSFGDRVILDLVREWKAPFSPETVTREIADVVKRYGLKSVVGDRYGGEWPRERFRVHGIEYRIASMTRSDAYLTLLPALNTPGKVELLDNRRLVSQLCGLERRVARGGKDSVDHPRGAHDDLINAAALALVALLKPLSGAEGWIEFYRRECAKAGLLDADGQLLPAGTDTDAVRAGDGRGWRFTSQSDYVAICVPDAIVKDGRVLDAGGFPIGFRWSENIAYIDVLHDAARDFLRRPAWRACNGALARELVGETAA